MGRARHQRQEARRVREVEADRADAGAQPEVGRREVPEGVRALAAVRPTGEGRVSPRRRAIRRETALRVVQPLEHAPCTEARLQAMVMNRLQLLRSLGWPVYGWRSNSGSMLNPRGRLVR